MRLLSYRGPDGRPGWGLLDADADADAHPDPAGARVVDVPAAGEELGRSYPRGVADLVAMPEPSRTALLRDLAELPAAVRQRAGRQLATVALGAPLAARRNVFAVGVNYRAHVEESGHSAVPPDRPVVFTKASTAVTGPGDVTVDPALTQRVDWEGELAVVLGTGGRYLSPEQARRAVFGYTVANDLSARDQQHGRPEGQWFLGKSLDDFCPLGPWLVTADEVADPHDLMLRLTVNGVVKQQAHTGDMIFSIEQIVAELSRFITLLPGDILLTGTPAGVGDARTPPEYLADGDIVVAEVSGIGVLANRIVHRVPGGVR